MRRKHPVRWNWGNRRGRPWLYDEIIQANCARYQFNMKDSEIAAFLHRSVRAVRHKIGPSRRYGKRFFQVAA